MQKTRQISKLEYSINKNLQLSYEASLALAGQTRGAIGLSLNLLVTFFQEKKWRAIHYNRERKEYSQGNSLEAFNQRIETETIKKQNKKKLLMEKFDA